MLSPQTLGQGHLAISFLKSDAADNCFNVSAEKYQNGRKFYERCSLFALPSLYEPFGIAPLEAMLNGIPAIVSGRWALKETVKAGVGRRKCRPGQC
jgi:glycosyltransferase involved in cell wall biosynthesis